MAVHTAKRQKIFLSEEESLQVLLDKIYRLQPIHTAGRTCCDKSDEWKMRLYGWHNPLFPPEYRRCCLTGEQLEVEPSCDLYYYMAHYYEILTGQKAPYNFELDRSWRRCIASHSAIQTPLLQTALNDIIEGCTRWQYRKRIRNAAELIKKDSVRTLEKQCAFQGEKHCIIMCR